MDDTGDPVTRALTQALAAARSADPMEAKSDYALRAIIGEYEVARAQAPDLDREALAWLADPGAYQAAHPDLDAAGMVRHVRLRQRAQDAHLVVRQRAGAEAPA